MNRLTRVSLRLMPRLWRCSRGPLLLAAILTLTAGAGGLAEMAGPTSVAGLARVYALPRLHAQVPAAEVGGTAAAVPDTAVLTLQRRVIAVFRTTLGTRTPAERAAAARQRLVAIAARDGSVAITSRAVPEGVLVLADTAPVLSITAGDLAAGQTMEEARQRAMESLRVALAESVEERSVGALLRGSVLAILATLSFGLFLRVLSWVRRRLMALAPRVAGRHAHGVAIAGFSLFTGEQLRTVARRLVQLASWALGLFGAYVWLAFVLTRFAYSRPWGEALGSYLTASVTEIGTAAVAAIPGLFTVVLIVVITRWLARLVGAFFDAVEHGGVEVPWLHPDTANPTKRISIALLWLFAIVVIYPYLPGSGSDVFKGVSVFVGLVISLGSSGIVTQGMSGLVLMYSRALRAGEYVRIGDSEGTVTQLGMLSTKIRTNDQEELTLPNSLVVGASVRNFSRLSAQGGVVIHTTVTIGYDTPWRQVEAMLLEAARRSAGVLAEPVPFVLRTALSDFYIEYRLSVHVETPSRQRWIRSELHGHIVDVFNEHGVQITSPHYESDPPTLQVVPPERWFAAPARRPTPMESPDSAE